MVGHSKWAGVKHRRGQQGVKKGKIFIKLIHELTVAVRQGGGAPADNLHLHLTVNKTLTVNTTRDTIDRAIAHSADSNDTGNMVELSYGGYASSDVAIIVGTMADNRNHVAAEVRHAFGRCGGNLGTDSPVAYMFGRKGQISFAPGVDGEALIDAALEAGIGGAVVDDDDPIDVFITFTGFTSVNKVLAIAGFKGDGTEVIMIPSTTAVLDLETVQKMLKLIDMLEDPDDVQSVYSNADTPDDVMAQLG